MNTHVWTQYFLANRHRFIEPPLPARGSTLPESIRMPIARSLAIFQLGESGGGTRLMRYVQRVVSEDRLSGYEEAVQLFIEEEQYHARLLEKLVNHLDGTCLRKQWTNSVFRWLRNHFAVEFNIQILLIAELIAEAYYGALYRRCPDATVRICCRKILADEMRHLAFHAEFLRERLGEKPAWWRALWRVQFRVFNLATCAVVAWDHRTCFRGIGLNPREFARMASRAGARFLRRLQKPHTLWQTRAPSPIRRKNPGHKCEPSVEDGSPLLRGPSRSTGIIPVDLLGAELQAPRPMLFADGTTRNPRLTRPVPRSWHPHVPPPNAR